MYRRELEPLEAKLVEVSGRCKEFRDHPERKDLQSLLLVNLQIKPCDGGKVIKISHLWVLMKHIHRAGVEPKRGRRIRFLGSVYAYLRLGGKSKQRGLHGFHDFSILPMAPLEVETFKPGVEQRYETKESGSLSGGANSEETGSGRVGKSKPRRSKHSHRRRRNNRAPDKGPEDRDSSNLDDRQRRKNSVQLDGEPPTPHPDGGTEGSRDR